MQILLFCSEFDNFVITLIFQSLRNHLLSLVPLYSSFSKDIKAPNLPLALRFKGSGTDEIYKSSCCHFDTLDSFLKTQVAHRKSTTNLVSILTVTPHSIDMGLVH
jgi:hypothetical protein